MKKVRVKGHTRKGGVKVKGYTRKVGTAKKAKRKSTLSDIPEYAKMNKKYKQTGKSDATTDRKKVALKPGLRLSKNGNYYYETRANRSDVSRKKRI